MVQKMQTSKKKEENYISQDKGILQTKKKKFLKSTKGTNVRRRRENFIKKEEEKGPN